MRYLWIMFFIALASTRAQAETITIVADPWCPYNCEEDAAQKGYMVDIAQAAFKQAGIAVDYKIKPWTRAVELTREGKFDAIIGATPDEAPDFIYPQSLQGFSTMRLWVKPDSAWVFKNSDSLSEVKIGAIADYSYSSLLNDYFQTQINHKDRVQMISGENALELNLRKLAAGRIDVLPEDKNVMQYYFASRKIPSVVKEAGNPIDSAHVKDAFLFIGFSPKNPASKRYAALLDKGIKSLRDSGELKTILDQYHVEDWYSITQK